MKLFIFLLFIIAGIHGFYYQKRRSRYGNKLDQYGLGFGNWYDRGQWHGSGYEMEEHERDDRFYNKDYGRKQEEKPCSLYLGGSEIIYELFIRFNLSASNGSVGNPESEQNKTDSNSNIKADCTSFFKPKVPIAGSICFKTKNYESDLSNDTNEEPCNETYLITMTDQVIRQTVHTSWPQNPAPPRDTTPDTSTQIGAAVLVPIVLLATGQGVVIMFMCITKCQNRDTIKWMSKRLAELEKNDEDAPEEGNGEQPEETEEAGSSKQDTEAEKAKKKRQKEYEEEELRMIKLAELIHFKLT